MKKILLLFIMVSSIAASAQAKKKPKTVESGTIKGTVMFQPKRNALTSPDSGAMVMFHKSNVIKESEQDTLTSFRKVVLWKQIYDITKKEEDLKYLKNLNADTPEKFEIIDKATTKYFFRIKKDPNTITATIDGAGNYSVELKPGRYEVIFRSVSLPDESNILEVNGKVANYFVEVKSGETKIQDHTFKP